MELIDIFKAALQANASDIHIVIGKPPMIRRHGQILPLSQFPEISSELSKALIYSMLYEDQIQRFEQNLELDSSYDIPGLCRFRVNVLLQKNGVEAVLRVISSTIPDPKSLGLFDSIVNLTRLPRGLVLVTGPTGSGKTTTLACLIEIINQTRKEHILTIEDPIEFVYENKGCIIRQREVGTNTLSFKEALRHGLRQDPDVILVGEMRDLETISLALTAAETGHLVFATLHTQDAPQTIDRVIDVFPTHQQQQVRTQLSNSLEAVICQQLLPRADGKGRVAAREVMIVTPAIANLIREGKTHMIYSAIETGMKFGMISMDTHLAMLVKERVITLEVALSKAQNPEQVKIRIGAPGPTATPSSTGIRR
jgi:twitching motility protein PilT